MNIDPIASPRVQPPAPSAERPVPKAAPASRSGTVLALQARALSHERFAAAATAVAGELALRLGCERVSIGLRHQGRARVAAISDTADIRERQNVVRALAAAMDEAMDQKIVIVHPLPGGSSPSVSVAHGELAQANGQAAICTVPIAGRRRVLGALVFERRQGFDAATVDIAKDAATFVGPVLELQHRLEQPLATRLAEAFGRRRGRDRAFQPSAWQLGAALAALALVGAALWPTTFRVIASARVEGTGQRVIAAPVDGFVRSALLRPGQPVKAGELLATLEDRDLALERDKWDAELAQLDKQYREALSQDDAAQIVITRSKLEQAQVQLAMVRRQLERAQLTAPIDGLLISGDLSQSIGMPVERGQTLMTVAPAQAFHVVAQVDEQDIGALREGQRGQVLFGALASGPVPVTVTRISPVAVLADGSNVFEVDGRVEGATDLLRPGLRGVIRIDVAPRSLGWVWWHRASGWTRRTLWRVLG